MTTKKGLSKLLRKAKMQLLLASIWFFVFLVASVSTFEFLVSSDPKKVVLQFVPVLCIVFMAVGITAMAGAYLRLRGARMICAHEPNQSALRKMLKQRADLAKLRDFDDSIRGGCFFAREPESKLSDIELRNDGSAPAKSAEMTTKINENAREEPTQ